MERTARPLRWLLLLLLGLVSVQAQKISKTEFKSPLNFPEYFEDSDTVLVTDAEYGKLWRSTDAGASWKEAVYTGSDGEAEVRSVLHIQMHPYDNTIAFATTPGEEIFYTHDQGETWAPLWLPGGLTPARRWGREIFSFHAADPKKILLNAQHCVLRNFGCEEDAWYSEDGLQTITRLLERTRGCIFARSKAEFKEIADDGGADRIICSVNVQTGPVIASNHLLVSDDLFETSVEPPMSEGRTVPDILSIASVKGYIMAAAKAEKATELALFASVDGKTWHQAMFNMEQKLEDGYTVLESTNYSVQIVVQGDNPATGTLLSSNSNGTYYEEDLKHINKDEATGIVDFEKVQGFQGVLLANVIDNPEDVEKGKDAKVKSLISFHDGKKDTWKSLKADDHDLHLHSVTQARNVGRMFSSAAPGVLLGVGNHGDHLKAYDKGDLYVSNDAGRNWARALKGPYKYEFADQGNLLFAIPDTKSTNKAQYSTNHGADWTEFELDGKLEPEVVMTTSDSTSLKILVTGRQSAQDEDEDQPWVTYSIDFDKVLDRTCGSGDMEKFSALSEDDACVMGHKQFYQRRKADADCFIRNAEFKEELPENEPCACTKDDYECDLGFVPKGDECVPAKKIASAEGQCKNEDDTFKGPSGLRRVPGNNCDADKGETFDEEVDRPCSEAAGTNSGNVTSKHHSFKDYKVSGVEQIVYLERTETSSDDDETVLFLDDHHRVFISKDHGKVWQPMSESHSAFDDYNIMKVVRHDYINDAVFFITDSKLVLYSFDRCKHISSFEAPHEWAPEYRNEVPSPMSFHQDYHNWIIWTGYESFGTSDESRFVSQLSRDRGDNWQTIARASRRCEFIQREGRDLDVDDTKSSKKAENLIFCVKHAGETTDGKLELVKSADFFDTQETLFEDIVDFATSSEFIVVAKRADETLTVNASVYGGPFAPAHFPPKFDADTTAYTVLQSETHAVLLHVTASSRPGAEYGRIMKSNSNGTYYVTSVNQVNRNEYGYVDFEKVKGLEGVSIVNTVANVDGLDRDEPKKLQTGITHNDGADWGPLEAPARAFDGRSWDCKGQDCKINLYSFTQKMEAGSPREASSETAIGLMIGNGNVGKYLDQSAAANDATFLSTDGGMNWNVVGKGKHHWAFGDQGSVIVLIEQGKTNKLRYSLDAGSKWEDYTFDDDEIDVDDITTVPSDNSKNVLIWGRQGSHLATVNVDFSGLRDRECKLDESNLDASDNDYESWSPKHPAYDRDDNCIFGHQALYHRKKVDSKCWNGRRIVAFHEVVKNCECRTIDFECNFNYERAKDGGCELVNGFEPPDHKALQCSDEKQVEWTPPTPYRRVPLSTCEGGLDLEKKERRPCPGHEEEFEQLHRGLSGFAFFLVVICLPFGAAAAIGWWVYRKWDGKFGAIRLGENSPEGVLDIDKPWVRYPVMALSAVVAVAMAVPGMAASAWRGVSALIGRPSGRYTSRASFARNRGDYTVVEDEDELLGDDDDDEV